MLIDEDDFRPPSAATVTASAPRWDNESDDEYEHRIKQLIDIELMDFRYRSAKRDARMPFYPLIEHLEAHISKEAASIRSAIDQVRRFVFIAFVIIIIFLVWQQVQR